MNTTTEPASAVVECPPAPLVGVRSTGVYCRPGCPALARARPENLLELATAADARAAGFRPCRRCRPDREAAAETIRYGLGPSAFGDMLVAQSGRGVVAIHLVADGDPGPSVKRLRQTFRGADFVRDDVAASAVVDRVTAHICEGRSCDDLPLDLRGTPFQLRVWEALRAIPWGTTTTYGALAERLGLAGGARAVGTACGANPVALVVACHRVLRNGGGLGGYYYGLAVKQALLEAEGALPAPLPLERPSYRPFGPAML